MKSLIVVAHGSRRQASNQEVSELTDELRLTLTPGFDRVSCAFLELAQPAVSDQIEVDVASGCTDITLFPYFLAAGSHVTQDLPRLLTLAQKSHPEVTFHGQEHLGKLPGIAAFIASHFTD
jgi:sirohydrochlorin ferrochelatase